MGGEGGGHGSMWAVGAVGVVGAVCVVWGVWVARERRSAVGGWGPCRRVKGVGGR